MVTKTIRIWEGVDQSKTKNMWGSQTIDNINNIISSNISGKYHIHSAVLRVYADFDGAGGLANVYMKYGFSSSTNSIGTQLGGEHKLTKDEAAYPSSGIDISSYCDGSGISKSYGSYFTANIYTTNVVVGSTGALHISYAELTVTYYELWHYTVKAEPVEGGVVYDSGGAVFENTPGRVTAVANPGYKFIGWYKDGTLVSTEPTYNAPITANNLVFTAKFVLDKINKIYVGTSQPSKIFFGTQEVKEVYVDTTKVYG